MAFHWVVEFTFEDIRADLREGGISFWKWVGLAFVVAMAVVGLIVTLLVQLRLGLYRIWWRIKYKPKGWTWEKYHQKHVQVTTSIGDG